MLQFGHVISTVFLNKCHLDRKAYLRLLCHLYLEEMSGSGFFFFLVSVTNLSSIDTEFQFNTKLNLLILIFTECISIRSTTFYENLGPGAVHGVR